MRISLPPNAARGRFDLELTDPPAGIVIEEITPAEGVAEIVFHSDADKVKPGLLYLKSTAYKERFGYNSGRWLVVTTSEKRLDNLKHQTEAIAGRAASVFYFTTFAQVNPATILTAPIWRRGGETTLRPLLRQSDV